MDQFREFVAKYPKVRDDVTSGKKTWQNIYEDWVILGEQNPVWAQYQESRGTATKGGTIDLLSSENLKNIMNYVKKINPDSVSKTLNTVQKVLQITQSFGGRTGGFYNGNYNSWWD